MIIWLPQKSRWAVASNGNAANGATAINTCGECMVTDSSYQKSQDGAVDLVNSMDAVKSNNGANGNTRSGNGNGRKPSKNAKRFQLATESEVQPISIDEFDRWAKIRERSRGQINSNICQCKGSGTVFVSYDDADPWLRFMWYANQHFASDTVDGRYEVKCPQCFGTGVLTNLTGKET